MKRITAPNRWISITALFTIGLAFLPALITPVYATHKIAPVTKSAAPLSGSQQIKVGVYVLNIGSLDLSTGSYNIDFYLNFSCDQPCDPGNFDIMNGKITEQENQTSDTNNRQAWYYRVRADLITDLDMRNYPFDEHQLVIEIEDKINSKEKVLYLPDPEKSGIDQYAIVSGWELKGKPAEWFAEVIDHSYPIYNDATYSRYRYYITIYHPWPSSFLKALFAPIVIVLVGLLAVLMHESKITDRLALTTSSLVGAILYHLSIISSIPPVGYLTYMDKFMLVNYLVIAAALTVTVVMMVYKDNEFHARAKKLNHWTRGLIPLTWLVLMALITIRQFDLTSQLIRLFNAGG